MKIAIAQLDYTIGDFEGNLNKIASYVKKAEDEGADIVCFGELATCGYPPGDFLNFKEFIHRCEQTIEQIRLLSSHIAIVIGSPSVNPKIEGKDLLNSAYFLYQGEVLGVTHKALLPTYDIFDEYRYFEPAVDFTTIEFKGKKIALTVCEDIWNVGNDNPLYPICPMDELMELSPEIMINISASPFDYLQAEDRMNVIRANTDRYKLPLFYINHTGAQTDIVFDGGSIVASPDGTIYREMPYFKETLECFDLDEVIKGGANNIQRHDKISLIHQALLVGIQAYFKKLNLKSAILGLSGGIDSAVVAVLAAQALGKDNIRVVLMPSQYSSSHSIEDATTLAQKLGIRFDIIPIKPAFDAIEYALHPLFIGKDADVTEENIQARIRAILLMALSNKYGNILLNTSNKSEMAVGYGTLYGDMCGGLAVLGDIYKTEVYQLARYINREDEIIPIHSITKPPSAELRPGQKDSDSLPPYEVLDPILYQYIEESKSPEEIIAMGYDRSLVLNILRKVNINEFKRKQAAPVIRVSPKAFGPGRRMPIVGKYLS